ncbi:MAG: hypothetical protein HWN65_17050 [Candidatus Helarchaeota archaeon]|nr:hypothetical protein [Candidatus Helarchaeota archaeon]
MVPNQSFEAMWKLADYADVLMNEEFIFQINKAYDEDERFVLALFSNIRKFMRAKAKVRNFFR